MHKPTILASLFLLVCPLAKADILYSNMEKGYDGYGAAFGSGDGGDQNQGIAVRFVVTTQFLLTSVTLPVGYLAGSHQLEIGIYSDNPQAHPGYNYTDGTDRLLFVSSVTNVPHWTDIIPLSTATFFDDVVMDAGVYWLSVSVLDRFHDFGAWNSSLDPSRSVLVSPQLDRSMFSYSVMSNAFAFRVAGTAVPEPGSFVLLGSVLLGVGILGRRKKEKSS